MFDRTEEKKKEKKRKLKKRKREGMDLEIDRKISRTMIETRGGTSEEVKKRRRRSFKWTFCFAISPTTALSILSNAHNYYAVVLRYFLPVLSLAYLSLSLSLSLSNIEMTKHRYFRFVRNYI